jgi:outer membrane protein TolC
MIMACVALVSACDRGVSAGDGPASAEARPSGAAVADAGRDDHTDRLSAQYVLSGRYLQDWQPALRRDTAAGQVAVRANALSIERSPTQFDLRAAEAESAAERAAWFPRIRPVASMGVGAVSPGVGLSIGQMIYDFSQTRTRREKADISRALTEISFWRERNDDVRDALLAYVDAVEASEILAARADLDQRLAALAAQEADRALSGVAGQGDTLFLEVSRQENRRSMIRQEARLTDAQARLLRDAGLRVEDDADLRFAALDGACQSLPVRDNAPGLMRARLAVELATMAEAEARRGLFPRIMAEADVTTASNGAPKDNARIALEGGSLLGGGGRLRVEAAAQKGLAADQALSNARSDLSREVERLAIEERALRNTLRDYGALVSTTEQSLLLFKDRFSAGAATVSEAVRLEVERNANLVAIAETRGGLLRNCVDAASLSGALSPADFRAVDHD